MFRYYSCIPRLCIELDIAKLGRNLIALRVSCCLPCNALRQLGFTLRKVFPEVNASDFCELIHSCYFVVLNKTNSGCKRAQTLQRS